MSAAEQFAKSAGGPIGVAVAVIGVIGVIYVIFGDKIKNAVAAVGNSVNPTSDQNLAYRGVNAVGEVLSGDPSWSLGGWVYDLTHPSESEIVGKEFETRQTNVRKESLVYGAVSPARTTGQ
jgi:hypothetical protein